MTLDAPDAAPLAHVVAASAKSGAKTCRVAVTEVVDTRDDAQMGMVGGRLVRASDPTGWVRRGLAELKAEPGLIDAGEAPDLTLKVEILKAYINSYNTAKSATVVLRVRYGGPHGAAEPRVYRGVRTAMNWNSNNDEVQGAMGLALSEAVKAIRTDAIHICGGTPG